MRAVSRRIGRSHTVRAGETAPTELNVKPLPEKFELRPPPITSMDRFLVLSRVEQAEKPKPAPPVRDPRVSSLQETVNHLQRENEDLRKTVKWLQRSVMEIFAAAREAEPKEPRRARKT